MKNFQREALYLVALSHQAVGGRQGGSRTNVDLLAGPFWGCITGPSWLFFFLGGVGGDRVWVLPYCILGEFPKHNG